MSDSSDDMELYSGFIDGADELEYEDLYLKIKEVLDYCEPHLEQMWAAKVSSILLSCDFRDAKQHKKKYDSWYEENF